jgi:hypothetical protein
MFQSHTKQQANSSRLPCLVVICNAGKNRSILKYFESLLNELFLGHVSSLFLVVLACEFFILVTYSSLMCLAKILCP